MECPLIPKKIIEWAQEVCTSPYPFHPQNQTYEQAIKHFENMFSLTNCRPQKKQVKLHGDNKELEVVTFNIPAMLESLFEDSTINCYENLVVNPIIDLENMCHQMAALKR